MSCSNNSSVLPSKIPNFPCLCIVKNACTFSSMDDHAGMLKFKSMNAHKFAAMVENGDISMCEDLSTCTDALMFVPKSLLKKLSWTRREYTSRIVDILKCMSKRLITGAEHNAAMRLDEAPDQEPWDHDNKRKSESSDSKSAGEHGAWYDYNATITPAGSDVPMLTDEVIDRVYKNLADCKYPLKYVAKCDVVYAAVNNHEVLPIAILPGGMYKRWLLTARENLNADTLPFEYCSMNDHESMNWAEFYMSSIMDIDPEDSESPFIVAYARMFYFMIKIAIEITSRNTLMTKAETKHMCEIARRYAFEDMDLFKDMIPFAFARIPDRMNESPYMLSKVIGSPCMVKTGFSCTSPDHSSVSQTMEMLGIVCADETKFDGNPGMIAEIFATESMETAKFNAMLEDEPCNKITSRRKLVTTTVFATMITHKTDSLTAREQFVGDATVSSYSSTFVKLNPGAITVMIRDVPAFLAMPGSMFLVRFSHFEVRRANADTNLLVGYPML